MGSGTHKRCLTCNELIALLMQYLEAPGALQDSKQTWTSKCENRSFLSLIGILREINYSDLILEFHNLPLRPLQHL